MTDREFVTRMKNTRIVNEIDNRFGRLQNYIYNNKDIPDEKKEYIISLCIQCDDMISKILMNEGGNDENR